MPRHRVHSSRLFSTLLTLVAMSAVFTSTRRACAEQFHTYIGTYTNGSSQGIYHSLFDTDSGSLTSPTLAAEMDNPSFLAIHPSGDFLIAVGETMDQTDEQSGLKSGTIHSFRINRESGGLTRLDSVVSGGGAPCHINIDATGHFALVANYMGGNATVTRINRDGTLGERTALVQHSGSSVNKRRQEAPHAHSINLDASNRFVAVADLGIDQVKLYRFSTENGSLTPVGHVDAPAGSGPRHFCFHPSGKYAYAINELLLTVSVFDFESSDETCALTAKQVISTLPADLPEKRGRSTAEILAHPNGRFVYGSNRGHNSLSVFSVDAKDGQLALVQNVPSGGKTPRNFRIDPSGKWLLSENQATDNIVVMSIDDETGKLTPSGREIQVGSPVCIRFLKK